MAKETVLHCTSRHCSHLSGPPHPLKLLKAGLVPVAGSFAGPVPHPAHHLLQGPPKGLISLLIIAELRCFGQAHPGMLQVIHVQLSAASFPEARQECSYVKHVSLGTGGSCMANNYCYCIMCLHSIGRVKISCYRGAHGTFCYGML